MMRFISLLLCFTAISVEMDAGDATVDSASQNLTKSQCLESLKSYFHIRDVEKELGDGKKLTFSQKISLLTKKISPRDLRLLAGRNPEVLRFILLDGFHLRYPFYRLSETLQLSPTFPDVAIQISKGMEKRRASKLILRAMDRVAYVKGIAGKEERYLNNVRQLYFFHQNVLCAKEELPESSDVNDTFRSVKARAEFSLRLGKLLAENDFGGWSAYLANMGDVICSLIKERYPSIYERLKREFVEKNKREPTKDEDELLERSAIIAAARWVYRDRQSPIYTQEYPDSLKLPPKDFERAQRQYYKSFFLRKFTFITSKNKVKVSLDVKSFLNKIYKENTYVPQDKFGHYINSYRKYIVCQLLIYDQSSKLRYVQFFWEREPDFDLEGPDAIVELIYKSGSDKPSDGIIWETPKEIARKNLVPLVKKFFNTEDED